MGKYPRIGRVDKRPNNTEARCPCGAIGKVKIHIEWCYMRGEDDVVWRCPEHRDSIQRPEPPIVVCDECGSVSNDNHREDCMHTGEVR